MHIDSFISTSGSEIPLLSILFNMIIYLGIIILLRHRKKIQKK